ncbi:MAG: acetyl-CoA carboxylase biotin carboxyl carrier protein [Holosporales bacterium]
MSNTPPFDEKLVRKLAEILNDVELTEIEYEADKCRIRVARTPAAVTMNAGVSMPSVPMAAPSAPAASAPTAAPAAGTPANPQSMNPHDWDHHPGALKSPMVGTAYAAPSPDAAPFVKVGDRVSKGQTVMIIEAMKVMNQIRAPKDGKVTHIIAKDGDPVEYDQVLMILE